MSESDILYAAIVILIVAFVLMVFYLYKWYIDTKFKYYDGIQLVNTPQDNKSINEVKTHDKAVGTRDDLDEEFDLVEIDI